MIGFNFKKSLVLKVISLFLVFAFSMYNVGFALTEEDLGPPSDMPQVKEVLTAEDVGISIDSGMVKSKFDGTKGKMVVHIQDAHCNYEAQSNINKILNQLTKECGIDIISVEGAEGLVDTTWFKAFPDAEIRKEVATYFMKKGEITGAEYFSITSDFSGTIFGAETRDYYIKNLKAFTEVYPYKDNIEKYFTNTGSVANRLKSIIYTPKLKEVDSKIRSFDSKEIELSDYAAYLAENAPKYKINVKDYPNFEKLINTLEYEDKIDFEVVDGERSEYIDVLSKKLSKKNMTALVTESIRFKKGHIKAVDFYSYLRELAKENDIDMLRDFPNLFYYYIYTKLYEGIDNEKLFKEINTIESALKDKLFKDDTQRRLDTYSSMLDMYVDLINIELTNDCYDTLQKFEKEHSLDDIMGFLKNHVEKYNLNYTMDGVPVQISENMPKMVDFYEIAIKRDKALIDNTLAHLNEEGQDRCVLIAGGFHTRGIKKMLEDQGVSYVVVTPKITKDVETPYIKVLTNQRTSLEDIITESAAMPGANMQQAKEAPRAEFLAPAIRSQLVELYLEGDPDLAILSEEMKSNIPDSVSAEDVAANLVDDVAEAFVGAWVSKMEEKADPSLWAEVTANWESLNGAYLMLCEQLAEKQGGMVSDKTKKAIAAAFAKRFSPGREAVRLELNDQNDLYEDLTQQEHDAMNSVIESSMSAGKGDEDNYMDVTSLNENTGEMVEGELQIVLIDGMREVMEDYNASHDIKVPMDVMVHPGRGGEKTGHSLTRLYIDTRMWNSLAPDQQQRLANHEFYHITNPERSEQDAIDSQNDDLGDVRLVFSAEEELRLAKIEARKMAIERKLLNAATEMAAAADASVGPDVVIVVSSSDEQEAFWQDRLTGTNDVNGSGAVVKEDAVVLSVSESNWEKGAGNGLGTLNGYVQAARKARELGVIDVAEDASVQELIAALMAYCEGKSAFMFHTAGKGTRTAPLPGVEVNSKPNIALPKMVEVDVDGEKQMSKMTILESVLMMTSICAPSRSDRLGVFWGDQIIINENSVDFEGKHNVEIFGQLVEIDEDIKSYGILIPGQEGDASQREKLPEADVRAELKKNGLEGTNQVYKSIGSFTISNAFLNALINTPENVQALEEGKGSLNTDPDWWQPLTSSRDEYIEMIGKKGVDAETAGAQWDRMNDLWNDFSLDPDFGNDGVDRKIGFNDVGENSLWWDYGQNKFYLENMQILTEDSANGRAARLFFGVDENKDNWVTDSDVAADVEVDNSVIKNSTIKKGKLKNCVVIDSTLEEVYAENAIIMGSTIIRLSAFDSLTYNVVDREVYVPAGHVLANIFHPVEGRIEMRTTIDRDGSADWKANDGKGEYIFDNFYTYPEIADLMKGLTMQQVNEVKQKLVRWWMDPSDFHNPLNSNIYLSNRDKAYDLAEKTGIDISEARMRVAHRMLTSGEYEELSPIDYATYLLDVSNPEAVKESTKVAEAELEALASREPDIWKSRKMIFDKEISDYVPSEEGTFFYSAIPLEDREEYVKKFKELGFGTSGLRDEVRNMTDMEVYINTRGYVKFLAAQKLLDSGPVEFSLNGDRRASTPRMMIAIARAIEDEAEAQGVEVKIDFDGKTPSPAGALRGQMENSIAIVITGSHIPFDMNGIKFYLAGGEEVLKIHEAPIKYQVAIAREEEYGKSWKDSAFDAQGMFKESPIYDVEANEAEALEEFKERYTKGFPEDTLEGVNIVYWQHSAVGRDIIPETLRELGAEVKPVGRSEKFVPVDTEKITEAMDKSLRAFAAEAKREGFEPTTVVFTDGDSDRPGVADENGAFLTGDKLGLLVTKELLNNIPDDKKLVVALPVSTNYGVINELKSIKNSKGEPKVQLVKTKIGSPHVVKAMNDAMAQATEKGEDVYSLGWEANGGFLLGSNIQINGASQPLTRLATRDAVLPIISVLKLAKDKNLKLSELFAQEIPPVYNVTGGYLGLMQPASEGGFGFEKPEAMAIRGGIISLLKPEISDEKIVAIDFETGMIEKQIETVINGETVLTFERETLSIDKTSADWAEFNRAKDVISEVFTSERGFAPIKALDITDGVQIIFANGEISHLRPSGNDPVFRNYVMTDVSPERAAEIAALGQNEIIPELAQKVIDNKNATPGRGAVRIKPKEGTPLAKVVSSILEGQPMYSNPHLEQKVWGRDTDSGVRIGEDWHGMFEGKSATVNVAGEEIRLDEVMAVAGKEILGDGVDTVFGKMPLNKILTPMGRLSAQFHEDKNELWIVASINEDAAGENPSIILGFSQDVVDVYGDEVAEKYKEALVDYGKALNQLIDVLEAKGYKRRLIETEDVEVAARNIQGKDAETSQSLVAFLQAKDRVEDFYNYRPVQVGDVIPIKARTLHALGAGINIVEPQVPGTTQSTEDGATYPVRYYFPGYERPGAKKALDIDRVGEILPEVTVEEAPVVTLDADGVRIEKMPGDFDDKGLAVERISIEAGKTHVVEQSESFHNLVLVGGDASVVIDGESYKIPTAGAGSQTLIIPATAKSFSIVAESNAQIIDMFSPVPKMESLSVALTNGSGVDKLVDGAGNLDDVVMEDHGNVITSHDEQYIIDKTVVPAVILGRSHEIYVKQGSVRLLAKDGTVIAELGEADRFSFDADYEDYEIVRTSDAENAVVTYSYEKTPWEEAVYTAMSLLKKNQSRIAKTGKIDLIVPYEMYRDGSSKDPGSLEFEKKLLRVFVGDNIRITPYSAHMGLKDASSKSLQPDSVGVLIATKPNIDKAVNELKQAEEEGPLSEEMLQLKDFLEGKKGRLRVLGVPDLIGEDSETEQKLEDDQGWHFAREVEAAALLLATVSPEEIGELVTNTSADNAAQDLRKLLNQLVNRQIPPQYLYYLLSRNEMTDEMIDKLPAEFKDKSYGWLSFVVNNLLLSMPIRPFDPNDQLEQRRQVLYSV